MIAFNDWQFWMLFISWQFWTGLLTVMIVNKFVAWKFNGNKSQENILMRLSTMAWRIHRKVFLATLALDKAAQTYELAKTVNIHDSIRKTVKRELSSQTYS